MLTNKQIRESKMASRSNVSKFDVGDDDEGDESVPPIPTQFTADDRSSSSISIDDLNSIGFNDARDEAERARLDPPTGDWIKDDRWKFELRRNEQDSELGDIDPLGRTMLTFTGKCVSRDANGITYDPMMFLRVSPDARYKVEEPEKADMAYRLFLKAKDLYLTLKGEKIRSVAQMRDMLAEDEYVVRTMKGDNGLVIVDIKPKQKERSRR